MSVLLNLEVSLTTLVHWKVQKASHGALQKLMNQERILEELEIGEIVDQIVPCLVSGLSIKTDQNTCMISQNTILLKNFENSLKIRLHSFYSTLPVQVFRWPKKYQLLI